MINVKYVYSVSDVGPLVPYAIRSIRSLRRFVQKEDIIIFLTPPRTELTVALLSKLAVVKKVENISRPFEFVEGTGSRRFGEKLHVCDVDSSTVVFLDDDVIVRKDLSPLLIGDFDFSARRHYYTKKRLVEGVDPEKWLSLFKGREVTAMPNAGFMIFKNYTHQKIRDEWLRLVNDPNLPNPCLVHNPKEQTALAIVLSGKKIKWLSASEQAYGWLNETNIDSYVIHKKYFVPSLAKQEVILWSMMGRGLRVLSKLLFALSNGTLQTR